MMRTVMLNHWIFCYALSRLIYLSIKVNAWTLYLLLSLKSLVFVLSRATASSTKITSIIVIYLSPNFPGYFWHQRMRDFLISIIYRLLKSLIYIVYILPFRVNYTRRWILSTTYSSWRWTLTLFCLYFLCSYIEKNWANLLIIIIAQNKPISCVIYLNKT